MKRILFAILLLALLLTATAYAETPAMGDTLHGFTVNEVSRIESLDADMVKLTHDKSGAEAIFVLNDDQNRGFSICFHTEPTDDTGMLHILEHAICAASEKYPGQDVFFDAMSQAYITEINAWTALSATNYYVTSLDEDQLEVMTDFYLDCAFHSKLFTEPNYFYREGWRYELSSPEDELTINGIVYNEMKGVYGSINSVAERNLMRTLFPDGYQSRDSGGNPQYIPDLSYDELVAFSKACYTPANSVSMFYGDVDMERFLALLNDDYFSKVDPGVKAEVSPAQPAFEAPVRAVCEFPVAEGTEDAGAVIFFSTALTEEESADYVNFAVGNVAASLLADNSSPLMEALNASGIASYYDVQISNVGTQMTINFYATGADASRDEEFQQIILDSLTKMASDGFDRDMLRSSFDSTELSLRLRRDSLNVAVDLFENIIWIQEMGNDAPLNPAPWYEKAEELCENGYAEQKMMDWVVTNPHAALVTTVPAPGQLEENERALAQRLAEKKAGMSDAEKQALVDATAAFNEWVQIETPQDTLDKISVVDPHTMDMDLEAVLPDYPMTTEETAGITVMSAPCDMDVSAVSIDFDLGHLSDHELARLKMYTYAMGGATLSHTQEEIAMSLASLTDSFYAGVRTMLVGDEYRPVYRVGWNAPNESLKESVQLVFELLRSTDLKANADLLAQSIDAMTNNYRDPEKVFGYVFNAAIASQNGALALSYKLNGLDYLGELNAAKAEYTQDAEAFIDELEALRTKALQSDGALVLIAGDGEGVAKAELLAQLEALPESNGDRLSREDTISEQSIAFVGSMQANYLHRGVMLEEGEEGFTADKLVANEVLNGEYFLPELRFQMGAYNAAITLSTDGIWSIQYFRGGKVFEADQIIQNAPEYLKNLSMTQAQLDAYKLPVISWLSSSSGELSDVMNALWNELYGLTQAKIRRLVEDVRSVTIEDVQALASELQKMIDDSGVVVLTTEGEMAGHEDEFDLIQRLP